MKNATYTPVFDFNVLFDTDFGIINLIDRSMLDKSVFDVDWFNKHHTNRRLLKALYERVYKNPLVEASILEDKSVLDGIYNDIMKSKYEEVLQLCMPTEMYNLLESCNMTGDIVCSVCYYREEELEILKKFSATKHILSNCFNISDAIFNKSRSNITWTYSQIYSKYTDSLLLEQMANVKASNRTFYIAGYRFNYDEKNRCIKADEDSAMHDIVANRNDIRLIDIYNVRLLNKEEESNGAEQ